MIRFASAGIGKSAEIGGNPPELFSFYDSFSSFLVKFHHFYIFLEFFQFFGKVSTLI